MRSGLQLARGDCYMKLNRYDKKQLLLLCAVTSSGVMVMFILLGVLAWI